MAKNRLPEKSRSNNIQRPHTRRISTIEGPKDILINQGVKITRSPLSRRRSSPELSKKILLKVRPRKTPEKITERGRLLKSFKDFQTAVKNTNTWKIDYKWLNRNVDKLILNLWLDWKMMLRDGDITVSNQDKVLEIFLTDKMQFDDIQLQSQMMESVFVSMYGDVKDYNDPELKEVFSKGHMYDMYQIYVDRYSYQSFSKGHMYDMYHRYNDPFDGAIIDKNGKIRDDKFTDIFFWGSWVVEDDLDYKFDRGAQMFKALQNSNIPHILATANRVTRLLVPKEWAAQAQNYLISQNLKPLSPVDIEIRKRFIKKGAGNTFQKPE